MFAPKIVSTVLKLCCLICVVKSEDYGADGIDSSGSDAFFELAESSVLLDQMDVIDDLEDDIGFEISETPSNGTCGLYCVQIDGKCHCLDESERFSGNQIRNYIDLLCTKSNCKNGFCLTPFYCECYDGFEKDENECKTNQTSTDDSPNSGGMLPCNCINGICSNYTSTCVCVNGYKMFQDREDLCEPNCARECVNGFCINPDTCQCDEGYQLDSNDPFSCLSLSNNNNNNLLESVWKTTEDPFFLKYSALLCAIISILLSLLTLGCFFLLTRRIKEYHLAKQDGKQFSNKKIAFQLTISHFQ